MQRLVTVAAVLAGVLGGAAQAAPHAPCGTVVMPLGSDVSSMSPLYGMTNGYNGDAVGLMYLTLLWIADNTRIDWQRSLAQSITTSDDQTFTVTLRPWTWSDGAPVTAGDVAFYFDLAKKLGPDWAGYGAGGMPNIVKSLTVISPRQFVIVTTAKVNPAWFIYDGIASLTPLPRHAWAPDTLDEMFQAQSTPAFFRPVDGPMLATHLDVGIDATFVPNPRWPGPPLHLGRLVFTFMNNSGEALLGLRAGAVDMAVLPNEFYGRIAPMAHTYTVVLPQQPYLNMINLNFRNPAMAAFADARVRTAMEDAIDQDAIVKDVFHGAGDTAYAPVLNDMRNFMSPAIAAGKYPVGYDIARARALLAAAGYAPGPDGMMSKAGKPLAFTFLLAAGSNTSAALYEAVQSELHTAGIAMHIQNIAYNQMLALEAGSPLTWEATGDGQSVAPYPSGEGLYLAGAGGDETGYDDATANRLIERNLADPDPDYLYEYEDYIAAQQPEIFLPRARPIYLVNDRLHGMDGFFSGSAFAPDQLYCTAGG